MPPRHPDPLPEPLEGVPFTTRMARSHSVGVGRLRNQDLDGRVYGVRATRGTSDDLVGKCRMYTVRLPEQTFFSHSTAARLLGIPLPSRLERLTNLHVTVEAPARAPHADGILGHSRVVHPTDVVTGEYALRVSSPARTFCEMGTALRLEDLVAVVDHLINKDRALATRSELAERVAAGDRITRSRHLSAALELADDRAESPPESRLRVLCVLAGLPRPFANYEVSHTASSRRFRLDLAWPELKIAIEYHGDYHREPEQWRRDLTRKSHLEADGWIVLELNAADMRDPDILASRIRATFARRR